MCTCGGWCLNIAWGLSITPLSSIPESPESVSVGRLTRPAVSFVTAGGSPSTCQAVAAEAPVRPSLTGAPSHIEGPFAAERARPKRNIEDDRGVD